MVKYNPMAAILAGMFFIFAGAACAAGENPKYFLYQNLTDKVSVTNALYWKDAQGNLGSSGGIVDPSGDYYSGPYQLLTLNSDFRFNVHSLHIGEVGGNKGRLIDYSANYNFAFGVKGDGLFLNRGFMSIQWLPFEVCETVTVTAPESDPFEVYTAYGYNEQHDYAPRMHGEFSATLKSAAGTELWLYHAGSKNPENSVNTTYKYTFSGDYSGFSGALRVGRDDEDGGRVSKVEFTSGDFPGTLKLTKSALLSLDAADLKVKNLVLSDGASIETAGGAIAIEGGFTQAGSVTIRNANSNLLGSLPNVEFPEVEILTVKYGSSVDESKFTLTFSDETVTDFAFDWRDNGDGTKTLVAAIKRPACYVSEKSGDDNADGSIDNPFATLSKAVSKMTDGVIYVLPGTYDDGFCDLDDGSGTTVQSRVRVPSRVFLKSTGGAQQTIIVGVRPNGDSGAGATRCVRLDDGAVIQGFTLTGGCGCTAKDDADAPNRFGGAVHGTGTSLVMDSIITNNVAYRGGGVFGGNYVRCFFKGNSRHYSGYDAFANANFKTCIFDSVFDDQSGVVLIYSRVEAYNCLFTGAKATSDENCKLVNCVFFTTSELRGKSNVYDHCVMAKAPTEFSGNGSMTGCKVADGLADAFDENYRPKAGCVAIDFGDNGKYLAAWDAAGLSRAHLKDFGGGQRIYDGAIDAGCGEYDWRGDYGEVLGRKVSVVEASSGAVLSGGYPVLHDGETLAVDFAHDGRGGFVDCVLTGNGTLYVWCDETLLGELAASGTVKFKSPNTSDKLRFTFKSQSGASAAIVRMSDKSGTTLILR